MDALFQDLVHNKVLPADDKLGRFSLTLRAVVFASP